MSGWIQGENGNYTKISEEKYPPKCRSQISGSTKDHFAGENEVCEISQTSKRAAKLLRSKRLVPHRCEVGFQLAVFGFQRVGKYRETSRGIPQHCAKWLWNHFNSELCTVWSIGLLTSWASKQHITCINWTSGSAPKVADSFCPLECFMLDFSICFPSLHSWFAYGKGLQSFGSSCF